MKTLTVRHACPIAIPGQEAPCESDVEVLYEVGLARDDFFSTQDHEVCEAGHVIPEVVAVQWYEEDAVEYSQRMADADDAADYYHRSGGR